MQYKRKVGLARKGNCIAIQSLYCREEGLRVGNFIAIQQIVLQGCVVGWEDCIVILGIVLQQAGGLVG